MDKKELYSAIGFIKISKTRQKILKSLDETYLIPSEIAKKTDLQTTQVSNSLTDLKKKNLVKYINEEDKKGRIYELTDDGKEVLNKLSQKHQD